MSGFHITWTYFHLLATYRPTARARPIIRQQRTVASCQYLNCCFPSHNPSFSSLHTNATTLCFPVDYCFRRTSRTVAVFSGPFPTFSPAASDSSTARQLLPEHGGSNSDKRGTSSLVMHPIFGMRGSTQYQVPRSYVSPLRDARGCQWKVLSACPPHFSVLLHHEQLQ
jgi:hypothetical protein